MSRSTLQAIYLGDRHENIREYSNSHGTAPIVWGEFCRKIGREQHWWLFNLSGAQGRKFWDLYKDESIPLSHRAVFVFLFDHVYVLQEHYRRFAEDLRQFLDDTTISAAVVNHWPDIAQFFEMNHPYPAVSLWCTSVNSDPWCGEYDEEKNEYAPFDWSKATSLCAVLDEERPSEEAK